MITREKLELYMSGTADKEDVILIEKALLTDDACIALFVEMQEESLLSPPAGMEKTIMRDVRKIQSEKGKGLYMSRKMSAAVCFCSAAIIILMTATSMLDILPKKYLEFSDNFQETLRVITSLRLK